MIDILTSKPADLVVMPMVSGFLVFKMNQTIHDGDIRRLNQRGAPEI